MGFKEDLAKGKEYEDEVVELFEKLYTKHFRKVTKEADPTLYRYMDVIEIVPDYISKDFTEIITAECKMNSSAYKDSPNVVVEFSTYARETSGISTSLAMFWVFKAGNFHIITKRDELIKAIIVELAKREQNRQIKTTILDNQGYLVIPIDFLCNPKICPSTTKHLTKDAYTQETALLSLLKEEKPVEIEIKKTTGRKPRRVRKTKSKEVT